MKTKDTLAARLVCLAFLGSSCAHHSHESCAAEIPIADLSPRSIPVASNDEYQPLLEGQPNTWGMHSGRVVLQPGESGEAHSTEGYEELLVVIGGRGEAVMRDGATLPLSPNDFVYIPPHTTHHTRSSADEKLVYIYVVAPTAGGDSQN